MVQDKKVSSIFYFTLCNLRIMNILIENSSRMTFQVI